jgi:hypothetical protein
MSEYTLNQKKLQEWMKGKNIIDGHVDFEYLDNTIEVMVAHDRTSNKAVILVYSGGLSLAEKDKIMKDLEKKLETDLTNVHRQTFLMPGIEAYEVIEDNAQTKNLVAHTTLIFASENEALQHLADISGKQIKVAVEMPTYGDKVESFDHSSWSTVSPNEAYEWAKNITTKKEISEALSGSDGLDFLRFIITGTIDLDRLMPIHKIMMIAIYYKGKSAVEEVIYFYQFHKKDVPLELVKYIAKKLLGMNV